MHAEPTEVTSRPASTRIHALDWLRVLALLGVFVYHTTRPFDTGDWHVKNAEQSTLVTVLATSFVWGLALFFLLAGAGSLLALRRRTPGQYVRERLLRLAVPLLTAYLLLGPVAAFIEETHTGRYHGSLPGYVPVFFRDVFGYFRGGPEFPLVLPWTGHLWFLVFLLWFSLLGLPLLVLLVRPLGRRAVDWLGTHTTRTGAVLLWAVPLGLVHAALRAPGADEHGWGEFLLFLDVFLAGAVLFADQRLVGAVRRDLLPALATAGLGTLVVGATMVNGLAERSFEAPSHSWSAAGIYFGFTVWAWAWMMVALSVGLRVARFQRPLPSLVGAAAMPFFLVHQPAILAVGYYVVRWDAGIAVKWLAILVPALMISVALGVVLARLPGLSMLFGVKRRRSTAAGLDHGPPGRRTDVTDNRTTNRDDGSRPPAETGDTDIETSLSDVPDEARVAEMKGAAVTVGPRGEIALDRSASGSPPESAREAEPDEAVESPGQPDPGRRGNPSTAVNEEPSG